MKPPTLLELHAYALRQQTLAHARGFHRRGPMTREDCIELNCADTLPVLIGWLRNVTVTSAEVPLSEILDMSKNTQPDEA